MSGLDRRNFFGLCGAAVAAPSTLRAESPIRLGLTPVFLGNDAEVIDRLKAELGLGTGRPIELLQRRTYREVTALLLEGGADAAWLRGDPYLQHDQVLGLAGVPVWNGAPVYQSCLSVNADDPATGLADLRGGLHPFSDPDAIRVGWSPPWFWRE